MGQLSYANQRLVASPGFHSISGLLTIDSLLNGRPDLSLDAARRLVLPVLTLSLVHWATLGRVSRVLAAEELDKEYVLAARGRGVLERKILWRHVLPNLLAPALNSSALSAATLVTGLFITELLFLFPGVSSLYAQSLSYAIQNNGAVDVSISTGFALLCVLAVLLLMTFIDLLQIGLNPRLWASASEL